MANGAHNVNNLALTTSSSYNTTVVCEAVSTASLVCFVCAGLLLLITVVSWVLMCRMHQRRIAVASKDVDISAPKEDKAPELKTFGDSGAYIELGKSMDANRYESIGEGMRMSKLPPDMPIDAATETYDGSRMPKHPPPPVPREKTRGNASKAQIESPPPRVTIKLQQINNKTVKPANLRGQVDDDISINDVTDRKSNHNYEDLDENDAKRFTSTYEVPVDSTLTRDRVPTVPERRAIKRK